MNAPVMRIMRLTSIRSKISIWVGACVLLTALIIISFAAMTVKRNAIEAAMQEAVTLARGQAAAVQSEIEVVLETARTLAQTLSAVKDKDIQLNIDREKIMDILHIIISNNPGIVHIYTCWEPDGFDAMDSRYAGEEGHDNTGRFAFYWHRSVEGNLEVASLLESQIHSSDRRPGAWYVGPKKTKKESVFDPFRYKDSVISTVVAPVIANGKFYGVVGIDLQMDFVQTMADNLHIYDNTGKMRVISNDGIVAGATGELNIVGRHMKRANQDYEYNLAVIRKGGETRKFMGKDLEILTPVQIGQTNTPWSVHILVPKEKVTVQAYRLMWTMVIIGIACTGAALVVLRFIAVRIALPIVNTTNMVKEIAEGEGDLRARLKVQVEDEIGNLAKWFNVFVEKLQVMIKGITTDVRMLRNSASDLSVVSDQMASFAEEMISQSNAVAGDIEEASGNIGAIASATEQMSLNIESVSTTAEQMSQNMNTIASSIEEMSTAINDVARSAQGGTDISARAMEMSSSATDTMNSLGKAAMEIGKVTELIKRIAEKTNLLSLNATIEAASAGDAGKGFAVVANEIKELAGQSAQAAEDIAKRIGGIQSNTEEAIKRIGDVSDIINNINESSVVITNAVEQQTITANEISGNVLQANTGINNIASSIAEMAKGANDVAKSAAGAAKGVNELSSSIHGVCEVAGASNNGAQQVNTSASELAKMAERIHDMIGRFKVEGT